VAVRSGAAATAVNTSTRYHKTGDARVPQKGDEVPLSRP
jgi:hypothetical protein